MASTHLDLRAIVQFGHRDGTHSQQKVLIERCLQDQALECALSWSLEESACRTNKRFRNLRNLDSRLLIRGSKK